MLAAGKLSQKQYAFGKRTIQFRRDWQGLGMLRCRRAGDEGGLHPGCHIMDKITLGAISLFAIDVVI